jgi:hypothetical protein
MPRIFLTSFLFVSFLDISLAACQKGQTTGIHLPASIPADSDAGRTLSSLKRLSVDLYEMH